MNRRAIEWTIKLGLALGCEIAEHAVFARKNYFYPDLPKGYQISQYDLPSCINGNVLLPTAEGDRVIGIVRAHLEEDAAKTVHVGGRTGRIGGADYSLVDYNRGGTPLVEIVTAPDIRSADEAKRFLQLLRQTIVELGISDAEMEKGHAARRRERLGPPGGLRRAAHAHGDQEHELVQLHRARDRGGGRAADRRLGVGRRGASSRRTTSTPRRGRSRARRSKEEADDYRYFPEPDLVPGRAAGRARRAAPRRAPRAAGRADPPHRAGARPRARDRARHGRARPALGARRSRPAPTRVAAANVIANNARRRGRRSRRRARRPSSRGSSRRATASRAPPSTRRSRSSASPASRPIRTSRRRRSRTRPSSSRSSTRSSRRTPARSRRTAAARKACSASSSAR